MRDISKREFLATVGGTAVIGGIAGCTGSQGDGSGSQDGGSTTSSPQNGGGTPTSGPDGGLPNRVRMVIPHGEGGGNDAYARFIINQWNQNEDWATGTTFVPENITAGDGVVGYNTILGGPSNGEIIGITPIELAVQNQLQYSGQMNYDIREATILAQLFFSTSGVMFSSDESNIESYDDLVSEAKSRRVTWGIASPGSGSHTAAKAFKQELGLDNLELITGLDGRAGQKSAILRGDVEIINGTVTYFSQQLEDGDMRLLFAMAPPGWSPPVDVDIEIPRLQDMDYQGPDLYPLMALTVCFFGPGSLSNQVTSSYRDLLDKAAHSDAVGQWEEETGYSMVWQNGNTIMENNVVDETFTTFQELQDITQ